MLLRSVHAFSGEYTVLFKSAKSELVAKEELEIESSAKNTDTLTLNAELQKASEIAVSLADYALSIGDTLCLNGTLVCKAITAEDAQNGVVVLTSVPEAEYTSLSSFGNSESTITVNLAIGEGSAYALSSVGASKAQKILSRTLPDSLQSKIQVYVDSATFPIWISKIGRAHV